MSRHQWLLEQTDGLDGWRTPRSDREPALYDTSEAAWDAAREMFCDTEHLSAMCRVERVLVGDAAASAVEVAALRAALAVALVERDAALANVVHWHTQAEAAAPCVDAMRALQTRLVGGGAAILCDAVVAAVDTLMLARDTLAVAWREQEAARVVSTWAVIDAIVRERDHYRERATTHAERLRSLEGICASAMRQGLAECHRLRMRATWLERRWHDEAADPSRVRLLTAQRRDVGARTWAEYVATTAMREGLAAVDALTLERDALRAIVAGRRTPPTEAELAAHAATGGRWRSANALGSWDSMTARDVERCLEFSGDPGCVWWPLDATRALCAWPSPGGAP